MTYLNRFINKKLLSIIQLESEEASKSFNLISNFFNIYQPSVREEVLKKYLIQSINLNDQGLPFGSLPHKAFSLAFLFRYLYNPGDLTY